MTAANLPEKTNLYDNFQLVASEHLCTHGSLSSKPSNGYRGLIAHQVPSGYDYLRLYQSSVKVILDIR
jgi:hypothetical protein